jgi:hypothetical protein
VVAGAVRNLGVDELAERVGWSKRSTERAITVLKHAPSEVVTKLKNREISLGGAERAMRDVTGLLRPPAEKRPEKSRESSTSSSTTARAATTTPSARGKDAAARVASEPPPAAPSPLLPQKADDLIESPIEAVADTFIARLESLIPKAERWPQAAHPRLERALSRLSESLIDAVERLETTR